MCGIAGFSGGFEEGLVARMNEVQRHRGPDDEGVYTAQDEGITLGHRRLSIIDLSEAGHQPMIDNKERAVIVYNGEIYNYRELRSELIDHGFTFRGHSDTETLLYLYLQDGEKMLKKLNGIFAFAIWDRRSRSLFLARDGMGVKPFYYATTPKGFLFASEIKALLQEPSVDRSLDFSGINYYLTYLWSPSPYTPISGVRKLEPGFAMTVREGRIERQWRHYDIPVKNRVEPISVKEASEQVEAAVEEAVRRQMISDAPVGAFLSGGLDSSAVVAMAKKYAPGGKLPCFTIGFNEGEGGRDGRTDDLPYAKKVADTLKVDLEIITVDYSMIERLEEMIYHLDEPQADPAPINALLIAEKAKENGIKVLLSGAGGDDIFSGYRRHEAIMKEPLWNWAPGFIRSGLSALARSVPVRSPMARRFSKAFRYADLDNDERLLSYFRWIDRPALSLLYSDEVKAAACEEIDEGALFRTLSRAPADTDPLNKALYIEGKHFLPDHNLNYTDKMGMAMGVEIRVPLLDRDLVDLATRLPVNLKHRSGEGKWIFKKAMERRLPKEVIYRPKTGFGAPLRRWIHNELKPMIDDTFTPEAIKRRGLFDPVAVRSLIDNDQKGRIDAAYTIFALLTTELWMRRFVDESPPKAPLPVNGIRA